MTPLFVALLAVYLILASSTKAWIHPITIHHLDAAVGGGACWR